MGSLTKIIKGDCIKVGQALKGAVRGAVQGVYTPVLMTTGLKQYADEVKREDISEPEATARGVAHIFSTCGTHVSLAFYAIEQGRGLEYFGALALTNIADYLVHAYKRSKE